MNNNVIRWGHARFNELFHFYLKLQKRETGKFKGIAMQVEYGAEVIDKNGRQLGTVDHLINDMMTGQLKRFMVGRANEDKNLFLSPQDIEEATESRVLLKVSLEEITKR